MPEIDFSPAFKALTENDPFPWQRALYERFVAGDLPASCNLPTGLGKTSVIAVWLIALAAHRDKMPRRLVYVVNRRTVVDQTTDEVEKLRKRLPLAPAVEAALWEFCVVRPKEIGPEKDRPLAISTLRGQFADNREWSADPSRPAVICGTVDMIGSRLLFSGYGCGFKTRPLHAGFLGQDSLVVHDEAHLEPAFQDLLIAIEKEQREGRTPDFRPMKVMELTATSRAGGEKPFELSDKDRVEPEVQKRIGATKKLHLVENKDEKKVAEEIADLALKFKDTGRAILVFVRKVDDVAKVVGQLTKAKQTLVQQLTGTLRGLERDRMADPRKADGCPIFARFLRPPKDDSPESEKWKVEPKQGTVYLVCTSAGEVGVNISADHLVCDLSTFESMAQRFGRVNRFGNRTDTEIRVIYPKTFKEDDAIQPRMKKTLELLKQLNGKASPAALGEVVRRAVEEGSGAELMTTDRTKALRDFINAAFAPQPTVLPVTDILFDSWALTTIRELPGRPPVAEYLHGVEEDKQRETHVAWRQEVKDFHNTGVTEKQLGELLDEFPLRPHELLRDSTWRIQDELAELADGKEDVPVWVIDPDDTVRVRTLGRLAEKDAKKKYVENLMGRTVVLPPSVGGLTETGTLSGEAKYDPNRKYDVAGWSRPASRIPLVRLLAVPGEEEPTYKLVAPVLDLPADFQFQLGGKSERVAMPKAFPTPFPTMRVAYRIDLNTDEDDDGAEYLVLKPEASRKEAKYEAAWPSLRGHLDGVKGIAEALGERLRLPADVRTAATWAGAWHDLGKGRSVWQRGAGNVGRGAAVAKTLHGRPPENLNHFRHELASMVDVSSATEFADTLSGCRELLLHMIATHHGRGRPHFPADEVSDVDGSDVGAAALAAETPARFAELQRKYGRWGLAYLESLLRAADALDSKRIEETPIGEPEPASGSWKRPEPGLEWPKRKPPEPSISVAVDPTNPGQFFACCGLLELADRLWPGAEGWFTKAAREFHIAGGGTLAELVGSVACAELTLLDADDIYSGRVVIGKPFRPLVIDWWHEMGGRKDAKDLKVWAGTMESHGIAQAMQHAMRGEEFRSPGLLDIGMVVADADDRAKKKEPYYFDARRGPNAHSRDVGFSPNDLSLTTTAFPAVEFLCLVGIQRCLPARTDEPRIYDYFTWSEPLPPALLPAAVSGRLPQVGASGYRFENWFRTGQRKHKAFRSAIPLSREVPRE